MGPYSDLIELTHSFIFNPFHVGRITVSCNHHHWTVYETILMDFNTIKAVAVILEFSAVQMARLLYCRCVI